MTPKEILDLIDGLQARGVHHFECKDFTVQMVPPQPNVTEGIVTFGDEDVKEDPGGPEKEPTWRGYTEAELFPTSA